MKGLQDETLFGNDASSRVSLRAFDSLEALPPITDVISGIDHLLLTSNSPLPDLEMSDLLRGRGLLERAISSRWCGSSDAAGLCELLFVLLHRGK